MFEKESKEHSNETLCSVCKNPTCTEDLRCREWRDRRAGFYCGAKFGYNKAKEELKKANELHFVDCGDLPKKNQVGEVMCLLLKNKHYELITYLGEDFSNWKELIAWRVIKF